MRQPEMGCQSMFGLPMTAFRGPGCLPQSSGKFLTLTNSIKTLGPDSSQAGVGELTTLARIA